MVDIQSEEYILGQNIRKYRLEKGWSQKQLSMSSISTALTFPNMRTEQKAP